MLPCKKTLLSWLFMYFEKVSLIDIPYFVRYAHSSKKIQVSKLYDACYTAAALQVQPKNTDPFAITLLLYYLGALKTLEEISLFSLDGWIHL